MKTFKVSSIRYGVALLIIMSAMIYANGPNLKQIENHSTSGFSLTTDDPAIFTGSKYGCAFDIRAWGTGSPVERWYYVNSVASGSTDPKLWYKDGNGNWQSLSDDDGDGYNFKAVIHVRVQNTTSRKFYFQAGWYGDNAKDSYWFGITPYTSDPNISGCKYLEIYSDGTMSVVDHP